MIEDFDFSGSDPTPVRITGHARERWAERIGRINVTAHPLTESVWRSAEFVVAPEADCDETRLYQVRGLRDMMLCAQHEPDETVVVTVMFADHSRLRRMS